MKFHSSLPMIAVWLLGASSPGLMAQPGSGIRLGEQSLIVPSLTASYNYNSNVNIRERALDEGGEDLDDEDSDSFLSTGARLSLQHWNASTRLTGTMWFNKQTYFDRDELDSETYGVEATHFWTRPNGDTTFQTQASYQRAVDRSERSEDFVGDLEPSPELESISERVERDEFRAFLQLDQRLMTDLRGVLSYAYNNFEYNLERFNDRGSHTPQVELNHQWTAKTQPYAKAGVNYTEDEGFEDTAENPFYLLGVRYAPTPKLNFDVAAGYETYRRTPDEGVNAGKELEDSNIKWTARINYDITRKTRATLSGRTGFDSVASPGSSSREEISVSLALNHQTTTQISQRVSVAWREDEYLSAFPARGTTFDETKETLLFLYRVDYQTVRPWLSLFAQAGYEDGSSRIPGDSFTQTEIRLGATARY